ncbi:unnamed protein product [Closterium sp. NIES-54]
MEVARTSMIHAAAPHFLWPFAVRYVAHQLNLWPCASLPETSPTLRWTGEDGYASAFRSGARSPLFAIPLRASSLLALSAAPSWASPLTPRHGSFTTLARTHPLLVEPFVISSDTSGPAEGGDPAAYDTATTRRSSRLETPPGFPPRPSSPPQQPVAVDTSAFGGGDTGGEDAGGAGPGGAKTGGAETGVAGPGGAQTGGEGSRAPQAAAAGGAGAAGAGGTGAARAAGPEGARTRGARAAGAGGAAGPGGARGAAGGATGGARGVGAAGIGGAGAAGAGGVGGAAGAGGVGAGGTGGAGCAGPGGARTRGAGAAGASRAASAGGAGGATGGAWGAGAAGTRGAGAAGAGGAAGDGGTGGTEAAEAGGLGANGAGGTGAGGTGGTGPADGMDQAQPQLLLGSRLPAPAPHTEVTESLTERREPETCASTPVRAHRVAHPRPPAVPGTHVMALRPSSVPQRVALPPLSTSSLPNIPDLEFDLARAASPTVTRLLVTVVTDPDFESIAAFALVTELVDFAARSHLDCVANPDALDIPTPRSYAEAIADEYSSKWQTAMDAEMASWKSTGTYVDEVPPPGANIIFSPTLKMTTLRVLLHVAAQRDYELHSLDISTPFLQGSLHEEIWLRRPPGFTRSFPAGTQWGLRRPVYGLCQAPREWHETLRTILAALEFAPSSADPSLFLRTDTSLPPFYVLVYVEDLVFATADTDALALYSSPQPTPLPTGHSLSAPPSDESVEPSGPYPELVVCLMYLMTCTRPDLAYPLSLLACYVAPGRTPKELLRCGVAIFDLDYDAILFAMYALSASAEGDCYRCVPPDPGIEAVALGASESSLPGTAPAKALHNFTLDSGASRCFFRDSTTLTPLPTPVLVRLADPSGGPVVARSSTVLPFPAVPSVSLSGLHLTSFSTNLVSTATLQDLMVTTTTPGGQRVSFCMCTRTGRHLATFTRRPGLSLYTLATETPPIPGTNAMALRPSSVPLRVPPPPPPESSLPIVPDLESDRARAASPTVSRLLATIVTDPSFESTSASTLVAELLDFAAACCLEFAIALVAESTSASPPSVRGECALSTDVLEDRQEHFECLAAAIPRFASMLLALEGDPDAPDIPTLRSYAEAIMGPFSSQWQAAMDAEMASWKSTGTYVDAVPLSWANIVDGMWIFRMKRPPGSPPTFKARYVARGLSQRQGVDYF